MGYCLDTVANFMSSNFQFPLSENLTIHGDLLPFSNEEQNLGSEALKWKDLYLSGETIYLGNSKITNNEITGISFRDANDEALEIAMSSIRLQDPSNPYSNTSIYFDTIPNISNYIYTTSCNISTRITTLDDNMSNYHKNTSKFIHNTRFVKER